MTKEDFIIIIIALLTGYLTTTGVKSQWVRVIDILVYSNVLFYIGLYIVPPEQTLARYTLLFMGGTTMSYNLYNFLGYH